MVMIDDATGRMQGRFFGAETLAAAMEMMRRWCERFGIPQSLYVDRHGIYRCDREPTAEELRRKQAPVTQFGRAMKELDVRLILAHSPQAKGRVERANGTLQDRLVKELRLAGIDSLASANQWLEQSGFFEELNEKFAVAAIDPADAPGSDETERRAVREGKARREPRRVCPVARTHAATAGPSGGIEGSGSVGAVGWNSEAAGRRRPVDLRAVDGASEGTASDQEQ
jgi:hypothetical protein